MSNKDILEISRNMFIEEKQYASDLMDLASKFRHSVLQALIISASLNSEIVSYKSIV